MSDTPQPASPAHRPAGHPAIEERLHPASPLVSLWLGVVALAWFAITSALQGDLPWQDLSQFGERLRALPLSVVLVLGAVVVGVAFAYWSWWTTRFVIDDTEFRLENTGAFQESKRIAFSRIQSVDVTQPFAARILGLAQVKIDVGSEGGATLSYLKRSRATEIRDYLMARAHGHAVTREQTERRASAWDDSATGDEVLVRLTPGEIILSALASGDIVALLLAFGIPLALAPIFDWPVLAMGGGLVGLALALFGALSKRLFGQFNYTLARTPAGLRITRGLFTLRSQTIPAHRVQAIETRQPLFWRLLGRARLDLTVLGQSGLDSDEAATSTIYLPFGTPAQIQVALAAIWPGLELDRLTLARTPRRARWLDPFQWPWQGYALDDRVLVARAGWTHRRQVIIPHARIQSIRLSQGPFERRLRLASVDAHTTQLGGLNQIHHLDEGLARRLAFSEMDRARDARMGELVDPPGLHRIAAVAPQTSAPSPAATDVWLPATTAPAPPLGVPAEALPGEAAEQ